MDESIRSKIAKITTLVLDVDGVLTDGKIIVADNGMETKNFCVRDGHGLRLLGRSGVEIMLLTGRYSELVSFRARDLEIKEVHQKIFNKLETFIEIAARKNISLTEVAFIGDDVIDVPLLRRVGFSAAPNDAIDEVKAVVDYVASKNGGNGAVREICEMILKGKNLWGEVIARYDLKE
ncbi:MAG: HAD hydrolase family protein [Deltaproteobacteria bacterium]|nr:HAD hydrolase family protein [Deltaproteobacteria bacterium]